MKNKVFAVEALMEGHPKYDKGIERRADMYKKTDDIRSEFSRDYNRILHSTAFRRMKHKTQVFYATENDHICTRIEHVIHVEAVTRTICETLGLNAELGTAMALGHDLGHAPFGHEGEKVINKLTKEHLGTTFWHEQNSLRMVDEIETLPDLEGKQQLLNLTYAVRDGIISHCGEVDEAALRPRDEAIDLKEIQRPNQYQPYTWEGCVVKIADKIAYLGRDIEDALRLRILSYDQMKELNAIVTSRYPNTVEAVLTTTIMHNFIINLCEASNPEEGLRFDTKQFELMKDIKAFNYEHIYRHERINRFNAYVYLVLNSIFNYLMKGFDRIQQGEDYRSFFERSYHKWLEYFDKDNKYARNPIYDLKNDFHKTESILIYISRMSDQYALKFYNGLIRF
ncbi:MAG: HD domain-containing protein [Bacteroidales bacterium]|nr:HD domain-containing protein [Bacteroidales bacterium]